MKNLITFIVLAFSLSTFAQERVELTSKEVRVNAAEAVLVRTNKTPKKVKVFFNVPMAGTICEQYDTRLVARLFQERCGTEYVTRTTRDRVCARRNPQNRQCTRWQEVVNTVRTPVARYCTVTRMVPESYCSRYGVQTNKSYDSMIVTFDDLPTLADSESDSFLAKAEQKNLDGSNVVWTMTALQTTHEYKISPRKVLLVFKTDGFNVEMK